MLLLVNLGGSVLLVIMILLAIIIKSKIQNYKNQKKSKKVEEKSSKNILDLSSKHSPLLLDIKFLKIKITRTVWLKSVKTTMVILIVLLAIIICFM